MNASTDYVTGKNHKITIRNYSVKDKNKVVELLRLNIPTYFAPEEEQDFNHYLENEIDLYYVLEFDEKIVGSGGINFKQDPATGYISWDILHPDFQGQGLGTLMLDYRIEKLKKTKKVSKIIVRTTQLVYKFYEKAGFKLVEEVKDYWAEGFDLHEMEYVKPKNIQNNYRPH